jgi:hypothetical protein
LCIFLKVSSAKRQAEFGTCSRLALQVDTKAPLKRITVDKALYEMKQFEFKLLNPFPADCDFEITLLHGPQNVIDVHDEAGAAGSKRGKAKKKKVHEVPEWVCTTDFPEIGPLPP